jgi:hypothetical protein
MTSELNTDWTGVKKTDPNAKVVRHRKVLDTLAIRVKKAELRLSTLNDVFEVADIPKPFTIDDGVLTVQVKCLWDDRKPKKTWAHIRLLGDWDLIRNYTGQVADNIK